VVTKSCLLTACDGWNARSGYDTVVGWISSTHADGPLTVKNDCVAKARLAIDWHLLGLHGQGQNEARSTTKPEERGRDVVDDLLPKPR